MATRNPKLDEDEKKNPPPKGGEGNPGKDGGVDEGKKESYLGRQSPFKSTPATLQNSVESMRQIAVNVNTSGATGDSFTVPAFRTQNDSTASVAVGTIQRSLPGAAILRWMPTYGVSTSSVSPINTALAEAYSYLTENTTGSFPFEAPDMAIYVLSIDSIYSLYYAAMRVIGLTNKFSAVNEYWGRTLVEMLGFDYDSWTKDKPNAVSELNRLGSLMIKYPMPPFMRTFEDHILMNSVLYADGPAEQSQLYAFVQQGYYSYELVDQVKGLTVRDLPARCTVEQYIETFEQMVDAFKSSNDVEKIRSKCLQVWGKDNMNNLPLITIDYRTPIVEDDMMLLSIKNADVLYVDPISCRITDALGGNLYSKPRALNIEEIMGDGANQIPASQIQQYYYHNVGPARLFMNRPYLGFKHPNPTDEEVLAAFRFKVFVKPESVKKWSISSGVAGYPNGAPWGYQYAIQHCGTEIITSISVWHTGDSEAVSFVTDDDEYVINPVPSVIRGSSYYPARQVYYNSTNGSITSKATNKAESYFFLSVLSCFKCHPGISVYFDNTKSSDPGGVYTDLYSQCMPEVGTADVLAPIDAKQFKNYLNYYLKAALFRDV